VSVRQYVLTLPFRLRFILAYDHDHVLVLDGVYTRREGELPVFHELPPPTDDDVAALAEAIARRVQRLLDKRGLADPEAFTAAYAELCEEQPALAAFGAASSQGRQAIGPNRGQPVPRLRGERSDKPRARRKGRLCAEAEGYNLHAATWVNAHQRTRLEKLLS